MKVLTGMISIIIPVFNKLEVTKMSIQNIKACNPGSHPEIIIVDNASTDETPQVLSKEKDIVYIRNTENIGISKAYNNGARVARNNSLSFMHNDVFIYEKDWAAKIQDVITKTPQVGIVGLYGAKAIRKDGSFRGKTIVHSKKDAPRIRKSLEKVAVVDGLLMAMRREVFEGIGGFSEVFSTHYYDKDISLRSLKNHFSNYVVNIPFEHLCATTRKAIQRDSQIRSHAQKKFIQIWDDFLPVDVSTLKEKAYFVLKNIF